MEKDMGGRGWKGGGRGGERGRGRGRGEVNEKEEGGARIALIHRMVYHFDSNHVRDFETFIITYVSHT